MIYKSNVGFIVGSGTMGGGIVQVLAQSNSVDKIYWISRSENSLSVAFEKIKKQWMKMVRRGDIPQDVMDSYCKKIEFCDDYSKVSCADFVVEAVSECFSAKKEVFKEIEPFARVETIFATNTSSLSITEISRFSSNPEKVVGLHFFNPAPLMKLVEVVASIATSRDVIDWALGLVKDLGKEPVFVNEAPGFIVNRMLIPMVNEAVGVLAEGVASADEIDRAMRLGANHPIGPLALADLIGNDVCLSIMETLYGETGDPKYRPHPLLRKMVRGNRLGRKTGRGFFSY